ncbi:MAG: MFS transporter [Candidatus Algichlamydia australiensis]|nr:MFS transporter [Chlamydiales bacterium]
MKSIAKSALPPLISLAIVMIGNSFFTTFFSLHIAKEGTPDWLIGILHSSYYTGILIGSLMMEKVIHRIGHIRSFALFSSINASVIMMQGLSQGLIKYIAFRFLVGMCASGYFIIVESWLLLISSSNSRGRALSLYMFSLYLAQGSGQFLLNFTDLTSFMPFGLSAIFCSLAILPLCTSPHESPEMHHPQIVPLRTIARRAPIGFIGSIIAGMMISSFYGLGPVYAKENDLTLFQISLTMGLTILGGLTLQWPIGALSDIFDRRKIMNLVCLSLIAVCTVLCFAHHFTFPTFLSLMVLFGGIMFTLYPLSISYTADRIPEASITTIVSVMLIMFGTGCILGPLLVPLFMELLPHTGFFLFMGSVTLLQLLLSCSSKGKRNVPSEEHFVPLPQTSLQSANLDPRQETENQ